MARFAVYLSEQRTRRIVVEAQSQTHLEDLLVEANAELPLDELAEGLDAEHGCVVEAGDTDAERVEIYWLEQLAGETA